MGKHKQIKLWVGCNNKLATGMVEEEVLTAQGERCQVYGQVMLFAGQFAGMALQVVSVTGVFSHPFYLVATVRLCCHLRGAAL